MADIPSSDPQSTRRDGPIALAIAAVVLATVVIGALAPAAPPKPAPVQAVLPDSDPMCAEWSDGCRVCRRLEEGPVCSMPGIACTPGPQECLHRTTGP
ncbi:hypothetical protein [Methylobacterium haplocladii]|uniref:Uncharacterized protein n=1 Tax=Methylobacterium haplocladii TaxID=1176176 RepID=A0A512IPR9_9HYPH|nr:hypothetical protein [Methylobacterium haplocladii]GEO99685.1 hypothetical protein MHA02_20730 [Methylobacterium haplocladii]GJD85077.1 hypothetical protein HPGCJGGD_2963 [Methylobacterium haplocladii]GLS61148.1 hypothetical protein GCM10007887_38440 [Methylobacterium haplocladii]